jgi:hypothetical protein
MPKGEKNEFYLSMCGISKVCNIVSYLFLSIYVLCYGAMFMCGVCLIMILHDMYTVVAHVELALDHTLFIGTPRLQIEIYKLPMFYLSML